MNITTSKLMRKFINNGFNKNKRIKIVIKKKEKDI